MYRYGQFHESRVQADRTVVIHRFSRSSIDASRHILDEDVLLCRSSLAADILGRVLQFTAIRGRADRMRDLLQK